MSDKVDKALASMPDEQLQEWLYRALGAPSGDTATALKTVIASITHLHPDASRETLADVQLSLPEAVSAALGEVSQWLEHLQLQKEHMDWQNDFIERLQADYKQSAELGTGYALAYKDVSDEAEALKKQAQVLDEERKIITQKRRQQAVTLNDKKGDRRELLNNPQLHEDFQSVAIMLQESKTATDGTVVKTDRLERIIKNVIHQQCLENGYSLKGRNSVWPSEGTLAKAGLKNPYTGKTPVLDPNSLGVEARERALALIEAHDHPLVGHPYRTDQ